MTSFITDAVLRNSASASYSAWVKMPPAPTMSGSRSGFSDDGSPKRSAMSADFT
jgi:hypothetical protein